MQSLWSPESHTPSTTLPRSRDIKYNPPTAALGSKSHYWTGSSGPRPTPHTTLHHRAHGTGSLSPGLTPHLGYRIDLVHVARIDMRTKRAFTRKGKVHLRLIRPQMAAR